jgi:2-C-methyl-D-erythritol 4-phosphate cytidylyltransferase
VTRAQGGVVAIVAAAGSGKRLGLKVKKPFVKIAGIPIIVRTLRALGASKAIGSIILAGEASCLGRFRKLVSSYGLTKVAAVVAGGATRADSVRNCLAHVGGSFDIVLIHDGGRPFIDARTIERSVAMARKYGGAIVAVPENDTVKLAGKDLVVRKTLDRSLIFRAQTPQVFKRDLIKKAYASGIMAGATDDAGLVERIGGKVKIVAGSYRNIKITTKEDLKLAEVLI